MACQKQRKLVLGKTQSRLNVGFVLANHFTLAAFANFVDALRLAADDGDHSRQIYCQWHVMSATERPVRASCGIEFVPAAKLVDPKSLDYVVVVGGLLHRGPQVDEATKQYLLQAAEAGTTLVGVCTGSFVLARLNLLSGRETCVSWYHRLDFREEFPDLMVNTDQLYLIDRDRITCSGGTGVIDLASALIERHVGASAARKSLNVLLLHSARAGTSAQPTPPFACNATDERVRHAALLMERNLGDPVPVSKIASHLRISERQLERLFRENLGVSPAAAYRDMRTDYGRWLLINSARSVAEIAIMAGFADGAHFSRAFRSRFKSSPSKLRSSITTLSMDLPSAEIPQSRRVYTA